MLKVKDASRLKAFGFEKYETTDSMIKNHSDRYSNCRIVVVPDGELVLLHVGNPDPLGAGNWKYLNPWFSEELYELFAAGLLVKVNDDEEN